MVEKVCGIRLTFSQGRAYAAAAIRAGADRAVLLCSRLDAAFEGVQIIRARRFCNCCWVTSAGLAGEFLALRGHASIQGSTDIPTLYDILPGYLMMAAESDETLQQYFDKYTKKTGCGRITRNTL